MNKKIQVILVLIILFLLAGAGYLFLDLRKQRQANEEMRELAAIDKQEMENEYEQFARQYSEMKTQINNDSIVAQLTEEQMKTQRLLQELKQVKSDNAREIARLKKELATVRAVLRSYVLQIDSLNRLNENLTAENIKVKGQLAESNRQIEGLNSEKASLSEKVAIAAQLNATQLQLIAKDKRGKAVTQLKKCKTLQVNFTIAPNVTATNGNRTLYVRVKTPTGAVLDGGGTFPYENRNLEYSMKKVVEYSGEETPVTVYWQVNEFLDAGQYHVSVFADGKMIGAATFTYK